MTPINFNLLHYANDLIVRQVGKEHEVWDHSRKKYVRLEPEEFVRQLLMYKLKKDFGIGYGRMITEKQLQNYQLNRFDLGIKNKQGEWTLLAECKSFNQKLDYNVLIQVMKYNKAMLAQHILITNGKETYIWKSGSKPEFITNESTLMGVF
jgi:hypothetical protein